MKKSNLKASVAVLALVASGVLVACGGGAGTTTETTTVAGAETTAEASAETTAADSTSQYAGVQISMLNTKGEIQTALEELAVQFEAETGIKLEVIAAGTGESPYTRVTSMYNSGTAPTLALLDTTDVVALASEYAYDLSSEKWLEEVEGKTKVIDGKVYSFPFSVEGRGIIYNKAAIENVTGREFKPEEINSYAAFKALLEELRAGGMENPVVLSKEDWSLGAHQFGYIYDAYDGTTEGAAELIDGLKSGEIHMADVQNYKDFVQTLELVMEYNVNKADPLGALYERDPMYLADKEAAFWLNGNWAWPNLVDAGADEADGYGFIPFVMGDDITSVANKGIQASPSKQLMVDNVQASEEQKAAALEFINWLVYSESGQKGLVEGCAVIPAADNNEVKVLDPLGQDIVNKMKSDAVYTSSYVAPGDHWAEVGALVQKFVAKQSDSAELAASVDAYWQSQK